MEMVKEKDMSDTKQELQRIVKEEFLLRYYNDYLFKHGTITEQEHRRMFVLIIERTAKLKKKLRVR